MRNIVILSIIFLILSFTSLQISAVPLVNKGYHVELYASGMGAVTGLTIGADGNLYAADYQGGRILRVTGNNTYDVYATGLNNINDLAFTDNGRLFADSGIGNNSTIVEVYSDGSTSVFSSGYSYPTSIEAWGNTLFVSNSGNGTISKLAESGVASTYLSGFSSPNGPFGISFDKKGTMYFVDHATGAIYSADQSGNVEALGSVSGLGGTFTGIGFNNELFVTDVNAGSLYTLKKGSLDVFATGFEGKSNPPVIGPNDFIFDGVNSLYVGDGDYIWRIRHGVPEPTSLALLVLGVAGLGIAHRRKGGISCD